MINRPAAHGNPDSPELLTDKTSMCASFFKSQWKLLLKETLRPAILSKRAFASHDMFAATFGHKADAPRDAISQAFRSLAR